jgi:hypothetical protein
MMMNNGGVMKRLALTLLSAVLIFSCADDEKVIEPQKCNPDFTADSLKLMIQYVYFPLLDVEGWITEAEYSYMLEECKGTVYTHEFTYLEPDIVLTRNETYFEGCIEAADIELKRKVSVFTEEDYFSSYDSVTVIFKLYGEFQRCNSANGDVIGSLGSIEWCDTMLVEIQH